MLKPHIQPVQYASGLVYWGVKMDKTKRTLTPTERLQLQKAYDWYNRQNGDRSNTKRLSLNGVRVCPNEKDYR